MKEIKIYNTEGKKIDTIKLDEKKFGQVNKAVLHQVVRMYLANQRIGAASAKNRKEVRGGGRKPWRQKGTGRARAGSIRSPIFRGGGVVFGPKPRNYSYHLPKKIKRKALASSISSKLKEEAVIIIDRIEVKEPKTKEFIEILKALKVNGGSRLLVVVDKLNEKLKKASGNVKNVVVKEADRFNAYDVLSNDKLVITKKSLDIIDKRVAQ
jgi:large subunit ribosomal protein L4